METENNQRFYVGQHVKAFVETEWTPYLITSVQGNEPWQYGTTTILKGKNFNLTPQSVRPRSEHVLLANDSFEEQDIVQEVNFSLLGSDDDSFILTQTVSSSQANEIQGELDDSLLGLAMGGEEALTLTSPHRAEVPSVNGCQLDGSPPTYRADDFLSPDIIVSQKHLTHTRQDTDDVESPASPLFDSIEEDISPCHDEELFKDTEPAQPTPKAKKSLQFAQVSEHEIQDLQMASKADRTHKQTDWGVKILKGNVSIFLSALHFK